MSKKIKKDSKGRDKTVSKNIDEEMKISDEEEETKEEVKEEKGRFKYSLFTKTGTPLYTAPEMSQAFRYSYVLYST